MRTGPHAAPPSSKDVERFQAELRFQADSHRGIVQGVANTADALNGIAERLISLPIGESVSGPLNLLMEGLGKILQGISDIHGLTADNISRQAEALTPAIEQLRQQESGIVIPKLERKH